MSCVSHWTVDILEIHLDCNLFFVEFIPLCNITLNITKCISPPIFNNGFQVFTAGLTTVRFWHCVDSRVDRTFRRNMLRPSSGWRNYVHVDAELYLQAIPSHKDGGSVSLRNVCVQTQKTFFISFDMTKENNVTFNGYLWSCKMQWIFLDCRAVKRRCKQSLLLTAQLGNKMFEVAVWMHHTVHSEY